MSPKLEVFHWALVTADFEQTAAQLGTLLGVTFAESIESRRTYTHAPDGDSCTARLRVAYSRQGPPYLELIQVLEPAGPFSAGDAGRIHHVGTWCEDIATAEGDLAAVAGSSHYRVLDSAGQEVFAVLTPPSPVLGTRIEYTSVSAKPVIEHWTRTGIYPK
jgi:hypothetical protein